MVIFSDGFESGDFSAWTGNYDGCTVIHSPVHHGSHALQSTGDSQQTAYQTGIAAASTYTRLYFRMDTLPTDGNYLKIAMMYGAVSGEVGVAVYNDGGTMKWGLMKPSGSVYVAAAISATVWYCLEFRRTAGTGANGIATLWVNGSQIATSTTEAYTDNSDLLMVGIDWTSSAVTTFVDCVVVADAYIGPESTYSPKTRSSLPNTMVTMLNSKMLYS